MTNMSPFYKCRVNDIQVTVKALGPLVLFTFVSKLFCNPLYVLVCLFCTYILIYTSNSTVGISHNYTSKLSILGWFIFLIILNGAVNWMRPFKPRSSAIAGMDLYIGIPPCSKALGAEHKPKMCRISPAMEIWLMSDLYSRYRIEDLITPHYW